jgi:hypothetical protein
MEEERKPPRIPKSSMALGFKLQLYFLGQRGFEYIVL